MTPTSRRQLRMMLKTFVAGGVDRFDVAALDHRSGQMMTRDNWSGDQVLRAAGWIAHRNVAGNSMLIRPARDLARHPFILIDDLNEETLARMSERWMPALVIETSPGSVQAWCRLPALYDVEERTAIATTFVKHRADPGGADGMQYGSISGTTNRKPERAQPDGRPPFARLRSANPHAIAELPTPFTHTRAQAPAGKDSRNRTVHRSPSAQDFAIACRLLEAGAPLEAVRRTIVEVRGHDAESDRDDDIERTVQAAQRRVHKARTARISNPHHNR